MLAPPLQLSSGPSSPPPRAVVEVDNEYPNAYIALFSVTCDDSFPPGERAGVIAQATGIQVRAFYRRLICGFAFTGSREQAELVATYEDIEFVEQAGRTALQTDGLPSPISEETTSWALDRIDQPWLPLDGLFARTGTGRGVTLYLVDAAVVREPELEGGFRACPEIGWLPVAGNGCRHFDGHLHADAMVSLMAGAEWGIARQAAVVSVPVLAGGFGGCEANGSTVDLLNGLEWVAADIDENPARSAIVAISALQVGTSRHVDRATGGLWARGKLVLVAAGNDACLENYKWKELGPAGFSPATTGASAIPIGATNAEDAAWQWFNQAPTLYAPGVAVGTAWGAITGTSPAVAIAAGLAAISLEAYGSLGRPPDSPWMTPEDLYALMSLSATAPAVAARDGSLICRAPGIGTDPRVWPVHLLQQCDARHYCVDPESICTGARSVVTILPDGTRDVTLVPGRCVCGPYHEIDVNRLPLYVCGLSRDRCDGCDEYGAGCTVDHFERTCHCPAGWLSLSGGRRCCRPGSLAIDGECNCLNPEDRYDNELGCPLFIPYQCPLCDAKSPLTGTILPYQSIRSSSEYPIRPRHVPPRYLNAMTVTWDVVASNRVRQIDLFAPTIDILRDDRLATRGNCAYQEISVRGPSALWTSGLRNSVPFEESFGQIQFHSARDSNGAGGYDISKVHACCAPDEQAVPPDRWAHWTPGRRILGVLLHQNDVVFIKIGRVDYPGVGGRPQGAVNVALWAQPVTDANGVVKGSDPWKRFDLYAACDRVPSPLSWDQRSNRWDSNQFLRLRACGDDDGLGWVLAVHARRGSGIFNLVAQYGMPEILVIGVGAAVEFSEDEWQRYLAELKKASEMWFGVTEGSSLIRFELYDNVHHRDDCADGHCRVGLSTESLDLNTSWTFWDIWGNPTSILMAPEDWQLTSASKTHPGVFASTLVHELGHFLGGRHDEYHLGECHGYAYPIMCAHSIMSADPPGPANNYNFCTAENHATRTEFDDLQPGDCTIDQSGPCDPYSNETPDNTSFLGHGLGYIDPVRVDR